MGEAGAGLAVVSGTRLTDRIGIGVLTRLIDRDLVDDVLAETGRVEQRSRLLPARVVVYYVLALCLFFGDAYEEVMRLLVAGLLFTGAWQKDWQVPTTGAIAQARQRLGSAPLQLLFERVAVPCAQRGTRGAWLGSRKLMAIDGFVLDIPDTKENDTAFGRSGGTKNPAPFPQVRVVGLGECGTHAIVAARLAAWRVSERALAGDLIGELSGRACSSSLTAGSTATGSGRWRPPPGLICCGECKAARTCQWCALSPTGRMSRSCSTRKSAAAAQPSGTADQANIEEPSGIPVRVIEYEVTNREGKGEIFCLITTIMDPGDASAAELAAAYQERWEFESSLDEIKTHQRGRGAVLRSKSPEMIKQEIWAFLLTHYAIRRLMCEAADQAGKDPDRLSFMRSLRVIRRQVTDQAALSPLPAGECPDRDFRGNP